MNIWSKVLAGCIVLASFFLFYFGMRMLKTEKVWQEAAQSYDKPLEDAAKKAQLAADGNPGAVPPQPGIGQLEVALHDLLVDRGKVWKCVPQRPDPANLAVVVAVELPDPHRIQYKSVLYAFEYLEPEQPAASRYMGEFKVANVAEKAVMLQLTMKPSERQWKQIAGSQKPWLLYERMPVDRSDMFAGLDQQQLAALMPGVPAEVLDEYFRDGKEAKADDPEARVMNGKYERPLRDYVVYFHALHGEITSLQDKIAAATTDLAIAEKTRDDVKKQIDLSQNRIEKELQPQLKQVSAERDLVDEKVKQMQTAVAETRARVDKKIAENKRLLAQWTKMQFEAAERLNELIESEQARGKGN
ncbi:MAG TPA: hypothetical protein VN699_18395 [Pirellulales bacterium]|nr:hypothetical protein [Pirellulales bacterium]